MDIWELVRRWHDQQNISHIAQSLDYDRKTIRKYIQLVQEKGITLDKPLPEKEQVIELFHDVVLDIRRPAKAQTLIEPYLQEIGDLVNDKYNPLKPKIAFEVLCQRHDLIDKVSYSSFKRFVRDHSLAISPQKLTCRIEVEPGFEVQIDYAKMGLLIEPTTKKRKTVYAFIATLSHSRHKYVEFVYKQDQTSFVTSNVKMFAYFGGVPKRILLDNLKSGVIKPDLYDPKFNRAFREMAEHYNCFLDPCRVRHPKDKGKVERDVQTIRQQFRKLLALNPTIDVQQANTMIKAWCIDEYGQRNHGTTHLKPYHTFVDKEQPALLPLPLESFQIAQWKKATVHPDHYVQFNKKTYSVPHAYVGEEVWIKGTDKIVQIYCQDKLIKQHLITDQSRHTDFNDFPPNVQAALDQGMPRLLQIKASHIGSHFEQLIRNTLKPHAFLNMRKAQGLLKLTEKFDHNLVEQAAIIALEQHLSVNHKVFRQLLEKLQQPNQNQDQLPISQQSLQFIREMDYFIHQPQR
jgi:transposase